MRGGLRELENAPAINSCPIRELVEHVFELFMLCPSVIEDMLTTQVNSTYYLLARK